MGRHEGQFRCDPLLAFSAGGSSEQFWHGQGRPLFDAVHLAFSLLTIALPILQGALKDGFGEVVMACDMPKPWKFLSLDSCQKGFLWTHMEIDLAPHLVVGLVLKVGNVDEFPLAHKSFLKQRSITW